MDTDPQLVRDRFVALDALLDTPMQWTQGIGARNIKGKAINPTDPQAVCWCLLGGIFKVTQESGLQPVACMNLHVDMMTVLATDLKNMGHTDITISEFNDDHQFTEIKDLIAKTIAALPVGPDATTDAATDP